MTDRVALVLAAAVAALHLAVANRYDLFRDELYFIVCGQHPAFGYADQPPLVPFLAAGGYALGAQTWIVRLPAVFAAAALVYVVVRFSRLLGGGNGAAWIAGIAAGLAPMLMGITATLNTTTLEPLAWTLVAYGIARAAIAGDRGALVWAGVVAGLELEAKYALPLWLVALGIGIVCTPERRVLRMPQLWLGLGLAALIALPSIGWQLAHGLPFVELMRNAGDKDVAVAPIPFLLNQAFVLGPLFLPVWLAGLLAPFVWGELRPGRFLSIAFLFTACVTIVLHGKDYYLAPAYPVLFALGGVALERAVRFSALRTAYLALCVALTPLVAPLALPILAPQQLLALEGTLHLTPQAQEKADSGGGLPPLFADMLGWHDFVREVGTAYDAIPPAERARTSLLVDNYGEAAALDLYGAPYGLPPALSGHNQYYFWGTRGQTPENILRVQTHPERLRPYCTQVHVFGVTQSEYARTFENGRTIAYCRGLHPALSQLWPSLRAID